MCRTPKRPKSGNRVHVRARLHVVFSANICFTFVPTALSARPRLNLSIAEFLNTLLPVANVSRECGLAWLGPKRDSDANLEPLAVSIATSEQYSTEWPIRGLLGILRIWAQLYDACKLYPCTSR